MESTLKTNILFLLHLPPPIHGSSMVGQYIHDSTIINEDVNGEYINLLASKSVNESGKVSLSKLLFLLKLIFKLSSKLCFNRFDLCYFALSTSGFAFLKDAVLVSILKLFGVPLIFHLHNKGIKNYANKKVYRTLYRFVFRNSKVIILSSKLYYDISEFVNENQIKICPNGIPNYR